MVGKGLFTERASLVTTVLTARQVDTLVAEASGKEDEWGLEPGGTSLLWGTVRGSQGLGAERDGALAGTAISGGSYGTRIHVSGWVGKSEKNQLWKYWGQGSASLPHPA